MNSNGFRSLYELFRTRNPNRINEPTRENSGGDSGFLFALLLKSNIDRSFYTVSATTFGEQTPHTVSDVARIPANRDELVA